MAEFSESDARLLRELMEKKRASESEVKGEHCTFFLPDGTTAKVPWEHAKKIFKARGIDIDDDVRDADRESDALVNRLTGE